MNALVHSESAKRVSACVTQLLRKQPFFGSLALRLPLKSDPSRKTLASDGREIRYAPQWISETPAHAIEAAIARVVLACALKHHTRRKDRDPERWQRASQLVTHALLREAGFTLPPEAEAWEGLSVEEAYNQLQEPDGDGEKPNDRSQSAGGGPDAQQASDSDGDGKGNDSTGDGGGGDTGSGAELKQDSTDAPGGAAPSHDPSGTGEVMDAPAGAADPDTGTQPSPAALNDEEQAWDEAMHQAANLAKAEGKLPGSVEETVRGAHISRIDWRTLLRRHMTDAARSDYSWSLPNRRFIDSGLYLPSILSEGIGTVAVLVDSSGSLPMDRLADSWSEVRTIAAEIQPERVIVLLVDTAVRSAVEYSAFDLPEELIVRGRGGTDFRPGFAWLEERGIRPGVCLYFTDMECSRYPETEPGFPVLWLDWSGAPSNRRAAPWGEHIAIAG
ncbi:MAG: VWA-like domain-containing protein [Gammaproteobacteria bacterium]|nr:VWA-like domain-containing protein [Gammaproteobacteria bacterium]